MARDDLVIDAQGIEVRLAAFDFLALSAAQIFAVVAAFGFADQIQSAVAIFLFHDGPIRIIFAHGSLDFEPGWELEEEADIFAGIET